MIATGKHKLLGICVGERSWQIAQATPGEAIGPAARFVPPTGATPEQIGSALAIFLREHQWTARHAVAGLPTRWLFTRHKAVPPTDDATLADLLRLAVESEFPTDAGELLAEYVKAGDSVLLLATPAKHVQQVSAICAAAGLTLSSVTATGAQLCHANSTDAITVAAGADESEMAMSDANALPMIRHLRAGRDDPALLAEVRRKLASLAPAAMAVTIQLLEGDNATAAALEQATGSVVQLAPADDSPAAIVAATPPRINLLKSRLAPPRAARFPRWVRPAVLATGLLIALGYWAYDDLQRKTDRVSTLRSQLVSQQPAVKSAEAFVNSVIFARQWMNADPRYVACVRDLTAGLADGDKNAYATNLVIREQTRVQAGGKQVPTGQLAGTLAGRTSDQQRVQSVVDALRQISSFTDVKLAGTQDAGRTGEVSFTVAFTFDPVKASLK